MPVDAGTRRVVDAYRAQTERLRRQVGAFITATWGALPDYRNRDLDRFVAAVVPVVEGSLRQMSSVTAAYLAAVETTETGQRVRPTPVAAPTTEALRGVPAAEVYRRPGVTLWTALAAGDQFPDAWQAALTRVVNIAHTDLQLAKTHTFRDLISSRRNIGGYRRVLEGAKSCGLCIVASTRRYKRSDLMPIHGGCDCSVLPIYGRDPGEVIDYDTLDDAYGALEGRFGPIDNQSRNVRDDILRYQDVVITHNHGELGPVLSVKGQHFTGPNDL